MRHDRTGPVQEIAKMFSALPLRGIVAEQSIEDVQHVLFLHALAGQRVEAAAVEGCAEVRRNGRLIASMRGGDFFGEIALVTDVPRTATVKTTSAVRVLVLPSREFRQLLRTSSAIQGKVLQAVAERLGAML